MNEELNAITRESRLRGEISRVGNKVAARLQAQAFFGKPLLKFARAGKNADAVPFFQAVPRFSLHRLRSRLQFITAFCYYVCWYPESVNLNTVGALVFRRVIQIKELIRALRMI